MIPLLLFLAGGNVACFLVNGDWEHVLVAAGCLFASYLLKRAYPNG